MRNSQHIGRTLMVSDIHGCYESFRYLLENEWQITPDDVLYLLGDYIDRGPASREVVDYILNLQEKGYTVYTLMGNHEDMMLAAKEDDLQFRNWLINGADTTLESFGVSHPEHLHQDYKEFFQGLTFYYELTNSFLVHAGFNFSRDDPFSDYPSMLWIRDFTVDSAQLKEKFMIHGHTPVSPQHIQQAIDRRELNMNIDTGCVFNHIPGLGFLCGLNLDTFETRFVKNIENAEEL